MGLMINADKTKYMIVSTRKTSYLRKDNIVKAEDVVEFIYLDTSSIDIEMSASL